MWYVSSVIARTGLAALALTSTVLAASCGSGASSDAGGNGSGSSTTAASSSTESAGAPGTDASGSTTVTLDCAAVSAAVGGIYGAVASSRDLGGNCSVALESSDNVNALFNTFAPDAASFEVLAAGCSPVTVEGATKAADVLDGPTARLFVLIDGTGTFQLSFTTSIDSNRSAGQGDLETLATLGAQLIPLV